MTVWVFTYVDWSDFYVLGVFDTEAAARKARDARVKRHPHWEAHFHVTAFQINVPSEEEL